MPDYWNLGDVRDSELQSLGEEILNLQEDLAAKRAQYAALLAWRPDDTPRADRDLPGYDPRCFDRDNPERLAPAEPQVRLP